MTDMKQPQPVELLILGAGWTSTFLIPLLKSSNISYAATTTSGRNGTITFKFDPGSDNLHPYKSLPAAKTVIITFPLTGTGQSKKIVESYQSVHPKSNWIQLGSTGIFSAPGWNDHTSPYNKENARGIAEDELLGLESCESTVLDLAGLYDDETRSPRNWVSRVAKNKVGHIPITFQWLTVSRTMSGRNKPFIWSMAKTSPSPSSAPAPTSAKSRGGDGSSQIYSFTIGGH